MFSDRRHSLSMWQKQRGPGNRTLTFQYDWQHWYTFEIHVVHKEHGMSLLRLEIQNPLPYIPISFFTYTIFCDMFSCLNSFLPICEYRFLEEFLNVSHLLELFSILRVELCPEISGTDLKQWNKNRGLEWPETNIKLCGLCNYLIHYELKLLFKNSKHQAKWKLKKFCNCFFPLCWTVRQTWVLFKHTEMI